MNPLTQQLLAQLKRDCARYLTANGMKPNSVRARTAIHTFWYATLCALQVPNDPYVTICLLSGRHGDLVDFTPEPTHA